MSIQLLLTMNGNNNGTVFTDYSPSPKTITRYGGVKTVTAQSKYYGSSGFFDGYGAYLSVGTPDDFSLHLGDYTVELWAYFTSLPSGSALICAGHSSEGDRFPFALAFGSGSFGSVSGSKLYFGYYNGHWNGIFTSFTPAINAWYHFAVTRSGNTIRVFVDGIVRAAMTLSSLPVAATKPFLVGRRWDTVVPSPYFAGYLQDIRVSDTALYTSDFTPPGFLARRLSGIIRDRFGEPCKRKIYVVSRPTDTTAPQILAHGLSDPTTGAYELAVPTNQEVTRVVVSEDDDPLLNDLVDRVIQA